MANIAPANFAYVNANGDKGDVQVLSDADITLLNKGLQDIEDLKLAIRKPLLSDGAAAHNCFYRGKDLTAAFDSGEFSAHVADGSFTDIFPGDFITKSITVNGTAYSVKWVVAHLDYYLGFPQTVDSSGNITAWNTGTHHCVMLPSVPIFNAPMNSTNVTDGGYAGSAMFKNTIPAVATGITGAFGSHVVQFASLNSTAVNNSQLNGIGAGFTGTETDTYKWMTMTCDLLSESQAYGACYFSAFSGRQLPMQFAALRLSRQLLHGGYGTMWWWLKNVANSVGFVIVDYTGDACWRYSATSGGVRPFCLIK